MRLAEVAGKCSCQMSLSPAHGIFLLKGASFSSPGNGAAMGQSKGLGLEDACIKLWVCYSRHVPRTGQSSVCMLSTPVQWSAWCHPRKESQSGNRVAEHQFCWTRPSGDSDNQVEHKPTLTVLASTANHALGVVFRLDSKKVFTGRAVQPWDRPPERWGMSILGGFSRLSHGKPQPS